MTPAKFRAKVNACGSAEIAQRAGTTRRSVERARARGAPPRGERGDAMLAAIAALSAKRVKAKESNESNGANGAEHRADGQHDSAIYRDERGLLTRERRIQMERQNAVEAGELVSTSEVLARVLAAASVLRMGHENARRNVESVCCGSCRGPAAETVDEVFAATAKAVGEALRG